MLRRRLVRLQVRVCLARFAASRMRARPEFHPVGSGMCTAMGVNAAHLIVVPPCRRVTRSEAETGARYDLRPIAAGSAGDVDRKAAG